MSVLDDLPGIFADALGEDVFYDAVLVRYTKGSGPAYNPGIPSSQSYPCKALVTSWSNYSLSAGLVSSQDRKILILADTLAVNPIEGDDITVNGYSHRITSDNGSAPAVKRDPSSSVWTCRGKS